MDLRLDRFPLSDIVGHELGIAEFTSDETGEHVGVTGAEVLVNEYPRRDGVSENAITIETDSLERHLTTDMMRVCSGSYPNRPF